MTGVHTNCRLLRSWHEQTYQGKPQVKGWATPQGTPPATGWATPQGTPRGTAAATGLAGGVAQAGKECEVYAQTLSSDSHLSIFSVFLSSQRMYMDKPCKRLDDRVAYKLQTLTELA